LGNYGLISKTSANEGDYLSILNSIIDYNVIMSDNLTPTMLTQSHLKLFQNNFKIDGGTQKFLTTGGGEGDNIIEDNTFVGSGQTFQDLNTFNALYVSYIIHNNFKNYFDGFVTHHSYVLNPFSVTPPLSNPDTLKLNGTYNYKVTDCDTYSFNLGNYYDDYSPVCNDMDLNNICDIPIEMSPFNISDDRVLNTYPYPFNNNLANEGTLKNNCGTLNFNIFSPTNNQNITNNGNVITPINWSYTSSDYNDLTCITKLNDLNLIDFNINSSNTIQYNFNLLTGAYKLKITCENNFKSFTSQEINFKVNNGSIYVTPTNPIPINNSNVVYGCTDINANNYNPLATISDNSCTYNNNNNNTNTNNSNNNNLNPTNVYGGVGEIINPDIQTTSDNIVGFIGQVTNGGLALLIPIGIFFFVILMVGGVVNLIK